MIKTFLTGPSGQNWGVEKREGGILAKMSDTFSSKSVSLEVTQEHEISCAAEIEGEQETISSFSEVQGSRKARVEDCRT